MNNAEIVEKWAREQIGSAYGWGATGKLCTPSYRARLMQQYPGRAADLRRMCRVALGQATVCGDCKYKGRRIFDCAQFVRRGLELLGEKPKSGCTSMWRSGVLWQEKGVIGPDNLEKIRSTACVVLRAGENGTMAHVGFAFPGGVVVEAMSTGFGVVEAELKGPPRYTHFALPRAYVGEKIAEERVEGELYATLKYGKVS